MASSHHIAPTTHLRGMTGTHYLAPSAHLWDTPVDDDGRGRPLGTPGRVVTLLRRARERLTGRGRAPHGGATTPAEAVR
jgi:hypothetical protein